jgi:hypothetical protein
MRDTTEFVYKCEHGPHGPHGPLKLRTVHFGDSTIIYENKISKQNIVPWFKGTIESRPHPKFRSIAHSIKKIEPPKAYFIHCIKPAFPGTPIDQSLFF